MSAGRPGRVTDADSAACSVEDHYQQCRERGIDFGPSFQGLENLWQKQGEALGQVRLPETLKIAASHFKLHPALLDACLQVLGAAAPGSPSVTHLPVGLDSLRVHGAAGTTLWSHARISPPRVSVQRTLSVDVRVFGPDGRTIASVEGLHLKRATREALQKPAPDPQQDWLYEIEWQARPLTGHLPPDYLPGKPEALGTRLRPQLAEAMSQAERSLHPDEVLNRLRV